MAEKPIVTQARLKELQYNLGILSNNLDAHVNASLAKAHGLTLLSGFTDTVGNDLTTYQDSAGNIWGNKFLRITTPTSGVFYAPATVVDPVAVPGKPAQTGSVQTGLEGEFDRAGGTAWVTDFTSQDAQDALAINANFIPHTNLAHWETHGQMVVYLKTTYDTGSDIVGEYVAQLTVDGKVYEMPCSKRFGGPLQPLRNIGSIPSSYYKKIGEGDSNSVNINLCLSGTPEGTKPITYQWENSNDGTSWSTMAGVTTNMTNGNITHSVGSLTTSCLNITKVSPGSDKTGSVYLRLKIENPAGIVYSNTCRFTAKDETGSWIINEVMKHRSFTNAQIFNIHKLRAWGFHNHSVETHFYTGSYGRQLVEKMREGGFQFETLLPLVEKLLDKLPYQERYGMFSKLIYRSLAKYWPDCTHEAWLKVKAQYLSRSEHPTAESAHSAPPES